MDINLSMSVIGITDDIRVTYAETSAPGAPVATRTLSAPHAISVQVNQFVSNAVAHIIKFNRLVGGVLGAQLFDFVYDPTWTTTNIQLDVVLRVGGGGTHDPAAGLTVITHPTFVTHDVHEMFRDGILTNMWEHDKTAGTVTLTMGGDVLNENEELTFSFYPNIVTTNPVNVVNSLVKDIVNVTGNYTVLAANAGSLHSINSASSSVSVTLPPIASIPENKVFLFQNTAGSQKISKIISDPVTRIYFNGVLSDYVYLTMGQFIWMVKNGNFWYTISTNVDYKEVGVISYVHTVSAGQLLLNGAEISRTEYARLWELIQGIATAQVNKATTAVVNGLTISPYKGFYGTGDGATTFTLPDLNNDFIRGLKTGSDTERTQNFPGGFQGHQFQDHTHTPPYCNSSDGSGKFAVGGDSPEGTNPKAGDPVKQDGSAASKGIETRGQNIGLLPVVNF
jgi:hypothetical protein